MTRRTTTVTAAALAVAGFVLGLLPWLVHGARLPVSTAWPGHAVGATPWVALPFSEYRADTLLALSALSGALAVLLPHVVLRRRLRPALPVVVGIVLALQLLALVQTVTAVGGGLADRAAGAVLVGVLAAIAVLGGLAGTAAGLLMARGGAVAGTLSATALVWLLPPWVSMLVAYGGGGPSPTQMSLVGLGPWLAAVLHGLALARLGLGSGRRVAAWVGSLVLALVVPAVLIALLYAGSSAHAGSTTGEGRAELLDSALDVAVSWVGWRLEQPWPLFLLVVIALVGAAVRARPGRPPHPAPGPPPEGAAQAERRG